MSNKPKLAFYWCASCGGCEEAVVDLSEDILQVVEAAEIVLWPCAMDFKISDVEALPDDSILATLLNGAVRTTEQVEMARMLRRKSRYLVAFGACAQMGGIPGLANQFPREQLLRYVYEEAPTTFNPEKTRPLAECQVNGHALHLPTLLNVVRSLDQVIAVDYYIPGCPPTPKIIKAALEALLQGKLPPKGTVLAPDVALCAECPRQQTKPVDLKLDRFRRPHLTRLDPSLCLLAQGVLCLGPATRGGCGAACVSGGMPCSGCFGPVSRVRDQGAKMLSSLCGAIPGKNEQDIAAALEGIPDPVGTFYRYGLAKSLLRRSASLKDAT